MIKELFDSIRLVFKHRLEIVGYSSVNFEFTFRFFGVLDT